MTREQITKIRESLKNITDEQIEKIADIIAPVIKVDHEQHIIDEYNVYLKRSYTPMEKRFNKEIQKSNNTNHIVNHTAIHFYAGWKACEKYQSEAKK